MTRAVVLALLTAATLFVCAVRPAAAAPALWVVQSSAGKLYLFGTVHLLRAGVQWRSPEVEAAMKESQELYLEVADVGNAGAGLSSLAKIGFDRDHPLSTKISKADVQLLDEAAKRYGLGSEATFEPMRPWMAYMVLSAMPALRAGYAAGNGVDLQIHNEFVAAGKPVHGFETFDSQAHIFADMPEATQVALLEAALKNASRPAGAAETDAIVNTWLSGDEDALASSLQMDKLSHDPSGAKLLTDRNEAWASALAERLKQPGTSFVAVGAAHLAGPDGVPALLGRMGFTVTRVQTTEPPTIAASAPSASPTAASTSSPAPAPSASATPVPVTLTPPSGWKARRSSFAAGSFRSDWMWVDPNHRGAIVSGHLDVPGLTATDLDTFDMFFHQGLVAGAGVKGTGPSTRVKICNGKQDGTYSKVLFQTYKEDIALAVSDRGYVAEYVRSKDVPDDPAAVHALLTLCAP